jgi:glycosyltransferase involved in cell wall biosynthesis
MDPLISIIIPNYNHSKYLEERLDCILNQTFKNFEIILLDDNSTDNSVEILNKFQKHPKVSHCIFNQVNSGNTFKQWEKGIRLTKGKYIWIAESDDFCSKNFLEQMVPIIESDLEIVLAFCQSHRVNSQGQITGNWITHTNNLSDTKFTENFILDSNIFIRDFLVFKNVIPNASAVLFRKDNINLSNQIFTNPEFKYCGDWMFYFIFIANKKIAFNADSLNSFRYHEKSVIAKALLNEDSINIYKIDLKMRKALINKIDIKNIKTLDQIKSNNSKMIQQVNYRISLILLEKNQYIKSLYKIYCASNWIYFKKYLKKVI